MAAKTVTNYLWIMRKQAGISIFPNALTCKKAQTYEISIYFSTKSMVALCHAVP